MNVVTWGIVAILLFALFSGLRKGASQSVSELYQLIMGGVATLICIYFAWQTAELLSPFVREWLAKLPLPVPPHDADAFERAWKLLLLALRDFSVLRFGILLLIAYFIFERPMQNVANWLTRFLPFQRQKTSDRDESEDEQTGVQTEELDDAAHEDEEQADHGGVDVVRLLQAFAGAFVGLMIGAWRSLLVITLLFVVLTLFPQAPYAAHVQQSGLYKYATEQLVAPFSEDFLKNKVPVWADRLEQQYQQILTQKYAWQDANIPADMEQAAQQITSRAETADEKARALYLWIGTRVSYDWDKVTRYERDGVWLEQTPEDTFRTKKGVCIDYARLYAVMARAVGLNVRIISGLGYDGRGGYGPHAWNEVQLADGQWVPLDVTWHSSGKDWFNPPDFYDTHVRHEVL